MALEEGWHQSFVYDMQSKVRERAIPQFPQCVSTRISCPHASLLQIAQDHAPGNAAIERADTVTLTQMLVVGWLGHEKNFQERNPGSGKAVQVCYEPESVRSLNLLSTATPTTNVGGRIHSRGVFRALPCRSNSRRRA